MADAPVFCSQIPREIFALAGFTPREITLDDWPAPSDPYQCVLHDNICSYAKILFNLLLTPADAFPFIVVPSSCDAMRKLHDVLARELPPERLFFLDVPRENTPAAVRYLAAQYRALAERLGCESVELKFEACTKGVDEKAGGGRREADGRAPGTEGEKRRLSSPTVRIGIAGSVYPARLFADVLRAAGAEVHVLRRCGMALPLTSPESDPAPSNLGDFCERLAARYLASAVCPRMIDDTFVRFLEREVAERKIAGLVVPVLKFCDVYHRAIDVLKGRLPAGFPLLLVENDLTAGFAEQTVTRLEAFMEQMNATGQIVRKSDLSADLSAVAPGAQAEAHRAKAESPKVRKSGRYAIGVDVGSTLVKAVVIDERHDVLHTSIRPTTGRMTESAEQAIARVLADAGLARRDVAAFGVTGYGRKAIAADETVTEISCHARGVSRFFPSRATVIDVGGQDSKVISIDERGAVVRFTMNDKCAAGTGRFIESTVRALELDFDRFSQLSLDAGVEVPVTSMCSVFAESEVISLTARGESLAGIARGINRSIARRIAAMVRRIDGQPPFVLTGGVSASRGFQHELAGELEADVTVLEYSPYAGAIGAAILALER